MTRRERLERKIEKRREWADSRRTQAERRFNTAHHAVDGIPPGQPILVGHHSEKRHRAALEKHDRNMRAAFENQDKAKEHESKAAGLADHLDRSIFSDDPDAVEALEAKLTGLEAERERIKAINKAARGGKLEQLTPPLTEREKADIAASMRCWGGVYHKDGFKGFPAYHLSNLGGNITRTRQRIGDVKRRQERAAAAEAAPGGVIIEGDERVSITFAEYPGRAIVEELRAAGFWYSKGVNYGERAKIPASVLRLAGIEQPDATGNETGR